MTYLAQTARRSLTGPPDVDIIVRGNNGDGRPDSAYIVGVHAPARPDACDPDLPDGYGQFEYEMPDRSNLTDLARDTIVLLLADQMHEFIEFVKIDGERIAEAHPADDANWEWMVEQLGQVVDGYIERWGVTP